MDEEQWYTLGKAKVLHPNLCMHLLTVNYIHACMHAC